MTVRHPHMAVALPSEKQLFIVSQVFRLRLLPIYLIIRPPAQAHLDPAHLRHHSRLRDAELLCLWFTDQTFPSNTTFC